MKKIFIPALIIIPALILLSWSNITGRPVQASIQGIVTETPVTTKEVKGNSYKSLYDSLELSNLGLSRSVYEYAVKGYEQISDKKGQYLTIVDFSQSSRQKRFYLLDMENGKLVKNTYVAHGKNSGVDMATKFSNVVGSEASSLGFYITKGTYFGKNGFSLKMSGIEQNFNDNAEARAIVVHGADYVNKNRVNAAYMGRSQGCPAIPKEESAEIIDLIKDGSVLFAYSPDQEYISKSSLLN